MVNSSSIVDGTVFLFFSKEDYFSASFTPPKINIEPENDALED